MFQNKAFLISAIYAVVNEMAQEFIPDRFPSVGDMIMNLSGVFLGVFIHSHLNRRYSPPQI